MPRELTPITSSTADGYYFKRQTALLTAGRDNFAGAFNLDERATEPDEEIVQAIADFTDAFVDSRALELGVTMAADPHYIATTDPIFTALSYWASRWGRTQGHLLRGTLGDQTNFAEGQMGAMKAEAEKRIDELLLKNVPDEDEPGGFGSVPLTFEPTCNRDEYSA